MCIHCRFMQMLLFVCLFRYGICMYFLFICEWGVANCYSYNLEKSHDLTAMISVILYIANILAFNIAIATHYEGKMKRKFCWNHLCPK